MCHSRFAPSQIRTGLLWAIAGLLWLVPVATGAQAPDGLPQLERAERWAFVDVTVLSMDRQEHHPGQTVLVEGDRITAVGPTGSIEIPAGTVTIEAEGRYLLPGLAEMHAHVPPGDSPPRQLVEEYLFLYLANGITTIRGMLGADYQLDLREELRRGEVDGPHFYVGAPSIRANTAPDPDAAEARVREHAAAGYDFLKIHPGVPLDAWDRMVEVADEVGITFGGHVPQDVGIHHAVRTGIATVDHLDGFLEVTRLDGIDPQATDLAELYRSTDPERLQELVEELADTEVWMVPTQYLWNHLNGLSNPDSLLALPEFRYVSADQREAYRRTAESRAQNPRITEASTRAHAEMRQEFLSAAHRAGVAILMGTDSPQLYNVPGFALHREIPLMVDAGMSNWEVLRSGTWNVARHVEDSLGQDGSFGEVAEGMRADLLLVASDPVESLDALREPEGVMVSGRWLSAEAIQEGLEVIARRYESP